MDWTEFPEIYYKMNSYAHRSDVNFQVKLYCVQGEKTRHGDSGKYN